MNNFIKNIITFSLKNRLTIFFLTAVLGILGIVSFVNTPIVAFPDFTNTQIRIITRWPGRSTQEIERFITIPIETSMNSVQRKTNLRSRSMFGLSVIDIVFEDDVEDMYGRQQIIGLLSGVDLPEGAETELTPPAGPIDEIYRYTIHSNRHTPAELRTMQDWIIDRQLRTVPGIADVVAFGGPVKTFEVGVRPNLLSNYGLSALDVYEAINKSNINVGGDVIEKSSQAFVVRGIGLISSISEIENIIVDNINGTPILVKNVATVQESNRPRLGQVGRDNEDDVVEGIVLMRKNTDPGPVLKALAEKVQELDDKILPDGVRINTFYNRQNLIDFCLHTVFGNVLEGILLVTLIVWIFMRDWRATLSVALIIPLALSFAFILLRIKGMYANLISIGAIDFGIIIDGAVVMVEGIFVALAHKALHSPSMEAFNRSAKYGLIKNTSVDLAKAIFFSKLIIITALIPVFSFEKVEGKIFSPLAFTLGFALLGALFFTLTFIPALSSSLFSKNVTEKRNRFVEGLTKYYEKIFDAVMRRKKLSLGIALGILVATFFSARFLGSEFIPHLDEGALWVEGDAPMSISLTESKALADSMRADLLRFPEVRSVLSQSGRPDDGTDPKGFFSIECLVDLYPKEQWKVKQTKEELIHRMDKKLEEKYTGSLWSFSQPILDNVNEAVAGIDVPQAVKVFGPNLDTLTRIAKSVYRAMKTVRGTEDVGIVKSLGQPELKINLNQEKMAFYGVTAAEANAVIEMAIGGKAASQLYEGEKKFDIRVRYQYQFRKSEDEISNLMIPTISGGKVPLKEISTIQLSSGPSFIYRDNNSRFMAVQFAVRGRDLGGTVAEAQQKVKDGVSMPQGYKIVFSGEYESQVRAVKKLTFVVPISLMIIFLILLIMFRNTKDALLILANVPFALIGGIFAMHLTGTNFNISAGIGFIALFGICIQNGVIIISIFKNNLDKKQPLDTAIKEGALSRMRPVVMTALMAIFGLLPAAMSSGIGSETQKPLAIVIVGGLITATILVLLILPLMFRIAYQEKPRFRLRKKH